MEDVLVGLAEQHEELAGLVADLDEEGWDQPSFCEGWTVADVVLHLAQSDEMAIGSLNGNYLEVLAGLAEGLAPAANVDEGAALMVARDRARLSTAEVFDRWSRGTAELRRLFAATDPRKRVTWVAGDMTARTLASTRLAECWIHSGDVAFGLGRSLEPTDRLFHIARLAWRTLPYAFARDGHSLRGPVAFELRAPSGELWALIPDEPPVTVIRGEGAELCSVAARRADPKATSLTGEGPDVDAVLELVRTYA